MRKLSNRYRSFKNAVKSLKRQLNLSCECERKVIKDCHKIMLNKDRKKFLNFFFIPKLVPY